MRVLLVPYHLDAALPAEDLPTGSDHVITTEFHGDDRWSRVATLQVSIADTVAGIDRPVILAGDCTVALDALLAGMRTASGTLASKEDPAPHGTG